MDSCSTDYSALAEFHQHLQRTTDATARRVREAGLQPDTFRLMIAIKRQPGSTATSIGALADAVQMDRNTVVALVGDLETQRLVARERDRNDRRRTLIKLTAIGDSWLTPLVDAEIRDLAESGPELLKAVRMMLAHAAATGRPQAPERLRIEDFAWQATGAAVPV